MSGTLAEGYALRRLERGDRDKGYFETLGYLTHAPEPSKESWERHFADLDPKFAEVWVAEETATGNVVGTFSLFFQPKAIHGISVAAFLQDFVVHEKHRDKKLGGALLDLAFRRCLERKSYKVTLECKRELIALYEKRQFSYIGESATHYVMERIFAPHEVENGAL